MRMRVNVEDRELRDRLKRMGWEARNLIENALLFGADIVLNDAQRRVPRRTGSLSRSIKKETVEKTKTRVAVTVGTDLEYAPYVEFGTGIYAEKGDGRKTPWAWEDAAGELHFTHGQRPKPYLRPAFDENVEAVQREVIDAMRAMVGM